MANYTYLYTVLSSRTKNLPDNNPMKQAARALGELNKEILSLTAVNEENRPQPMNKEKLTQLMKLYADLQTSLKAAHKSGAKDVASQYLDEVMLLTNRDLEALRRADPENPGDYLTATEGSEHYSVDISEKGLDRIGGFTSSRFPMSVPDGKGGFVDGYFTADSRNLPTANAKELVRMVINTTKNNELKRELENLIDGKSFEQIAYALFERSTGFEHRERDIENFKPGEFTEVANAAWSYVFNRDRGNKPEVQLNLSQEDSKRLFYMAQGIYNIGFSHELMRDNSMIPNGGVIGQRNAAMTAMADFLGVPKLVARSNQITVVTGHTPDGRPLIKNGTFMEKAEGNEVADFEMNRSPEIQKLDTHVDSFLKDVADIQMLDFICGNIDRHAGNFFVKSEVMKDGTLRYTGLVGIDNDQSFGLLDPGMNEQNNRMFAPGRMGYVSAGMADKVNSMTRADLNSLLAGFGLGAQAINAAWSRVQTAKKAISSHRVKIVPDDGWVKNNITLSSLSKANIAGKKVQTPGCAGMLENSCRKIVTSLERAKVVENNCYKRERDKYRREHNIRSGMNTPKEVKDELEKKARLVGNEVEKARARFDKDPAFKKEYLEKAKAEIIQEAVDAGNDPNDHVFQDTKLSPLALENRVNNIIVQETEDRILKAPVQEAPAQEASKHRYNRAAKANGLAVRLSPLEERLRDLKERLEETTREHGKSTEYQQMIEKLEELQEKTTGLLNVDALQGMSPAERILRLTEARDAFRQALTDTIEKTCSYISKKPANPVHQYGKDRLDFAKQLRSATLNAQQVLAEELAVENFGKRVEPERMSIKVSELHQPENLGPQSTQKKVETGLAIS